jgi:nucleoside-diphosphate-sugar epimerase
MLCDQLSGRDDVKEIVALDKECMPDLLAGNQKITWITANTSDGSWQEGVRLRHPDIIIHTAWQIREMYGEQDVQRRWNVEGSRALFDFAFNSLSVKKLVYFSTAAVYGAYKTNVLEHRFREDEEMREGEYSYGREKKEVEEILRKRWNDAMRGDLHRPQIFVLRPAAITGPRGRFMRIRFGLQSALAGKLTGNFFYQLVSLMVSFVPATPWWARQFVHEDDVSDIVTLLTFSILEEQTYETFNLAPPGDPVRAPDMARAVRKKILPVYPLMVRIAFFVFWHISRGKIPNSRGVWRFYSYPIVIDGSKITRRHGYTYKYLSADAFQYTDGRYEQYVPERKRSHSRSL